MSPPEIILVPLAGGSGAGRPLLVVGPSLGTGVEALWGICAGLLADRFDVVGWELPGHGRGTPHDEPFTMAELAAGVARAVGRDSFLYAGDSLGGAVGLHLLLDHAHRVEAAALIATGAVIGTPDGWQDRAALVRRQGTGALVEGAIQRWFAAGFTARAPDRVMSLLDTLRAADDASYARCCEVLAGYDVRARLGEIAAPVLAVAGAHDVVTTSASLAEIAGGVRHSRHITIAGAAHMPPAEVPAEVAALIRSLI
ncbi:alpha/beta fold hydrolase [Micromonospora sp. CPCC 206060]|uniref:alpha/beta fold hydrolase n=1 Tax=Micromonospora sp. CPCC 206060 TaxID=3122406 RepID=UPI002FF278BD